MTVPTCDHFAALESLAEPQSAGCNRCIEAGDTWVHLRSCLECGIVGCCDDSKNRHARGHCEHDGHPLVQSIEPHESWQYCFPDHVVVQ